MKRISKGMYQAEIHGQIVTVYKTKVHEFKNNYSNWEGKVWRSYWKAVLNFGTKEVEQLTDLEATRREALRIAVSKLRKEKTT